MLRAILWSRRTPRFLKLSKKQCIARRYRGNTHGHTIRSGDVRNTYAAHHCFPLDPLLLSSPLLMTLQNLFQGNLPLKSKWVKNVVRSRKNRNLQLRHVRFQKEI